MPRSTGERYTLTSGKKTAEAIHAEIAREVASLLNLIFAERRQSDAMDLEAVEMALRAAMHRAGAAALTQLLQFPEPAADQHAIPCSCGHQARYRELRSRRFLTVLGEVELSRPWYLCPQCHDGQFPVDRQLDIENYDSSPGVRRMQAIVGQEVPFDHGREQMKVIGCFVELCPPDLRPGALVWRVHPRCARNVPKQNGVDRRVGNFRQDCVRSCKNDH